MTRDLRFRLLIDNGQFLAAAAQAGQGVAGMGRQIVDSSRSASGALDGITDSARRIGDGVQRGAATASQSLGRTGAAASSAAQTLQQTAAAGDAAGRSLAQGAAQGAQALQQTSTAAQGVAKSAGAMRDEFGRFVPVAQQAGKEGAQALQQTAAGADRATASIAGTGRAASTASLSLRDLAGGAIAFNAITAAATRASDAITSIPKGGIEFTMNTEVAQLGMSGVFASILEVNGQAMQFDQAMELSAGSIRRLQAAAAETASSSGELIDTFQAMVGPAMAAGMAIEQVEKAVVIGVNAVKTQGLAGAQIKQELRDIIGGGDITAASSIATMLGITDADIAKAKASAEGLFGFVMQRMAGFGESAERYKGTLRGAMEGLQEEVTQASAKAMAPAVDAAKDAVKQISDALDTAGSRNALAGVGEGIATTIGVLTSGVGVAQQYGGAIQAIALAYGAIKIGSVAAQFAQVTAAKIEGAAASRLAATQAVLSAEADAVETQSSRAKLAALIAEERTKVQALATEAAVTAAKLRSAEASAAQMVGMQRLHAVETQVLPLRQQHATQTAALEQAQQRLASATTAASGASRAMGAVVGALGGPIGIAITAIGLLTMGLMSARSEAEKLGKTKLSVDRVEEAIAKGGKIDDKDAGRVRSALDDAKERRDGLAAEAKKPASMADRSKGLLGGKSNVEKRAEDLAQAEAEVKRLDALAGKIDAMQTTAASTLSQSLNLAAGASGKGLEKTTEKLQTRDGIVEAGQQRLANIERQATQERALMLKRNASAAELAKFDGMVGDKKTASQRETTLDLQKLHKAEGRAAGGEFGGRAGSRGVGGESAENKAAQLEKASADLRLAQLKQDSSSRTAALDDELQRADALHQGGLTGVEEYEAERLRIRGAKLVERLALIDAEIAAENKRAPQTEVERVGREKRVVELTTERNTVTTDIKSGETSAAAGVAARDLDRQRTMAAETVQLWTTANSQITQLRGQNSQAAVGLITDPVSKMRAEAAAQVAALKASADELTRQLELKISLTTDPGQREMLKEQIDGVAEETSRAIVIANDGLAARMKPGWQTMLEGWRDTTKLMREASDQSMSGMLSKAEDSFVNFRKTGKINIEGMVSDWVDGQMRMQFRKFMGGETGTSITGFLAGLTGGGTADGTSLPVDMAGPVMPGAVASERASPADRAVDGLASGATDAASGLRNAATEGSALTGALGAVGRSLGGFGGDVMRAGSALLSMMQNASSGAAAGGGGGGIAGMLVAGVRALAGGVGAPGNAGAGDYSAAGMKAAFGYAKGGAFDGEEVRFAAGGGFTNQIIDRDTNFRFREGGRERLGLMGEAGPEAIMPLSGGGAQAISADGRKLGNVPVQRGPSGRLSVVLDGILSAAPQQQRLAPAAAQTGPGRLSAFAVGAVFGGATSPATSQLTTGAAAQLKASATPASAMKAGDLSIDASTVLNVMDMGKVQAMVSQACMGVERRIYEHLRTVGAMR